MTVVAEPGLTDVNVEDGGAVLRGLLVPFGRPALCADRRSDGALRLYLETFDAASLNPIIGRIPLLQSHLESAPIGVVNRTWTSERGLEIEGEIIGSDPEVEGIRRRIARGLHASLSVGFLADKNADLWEAPTTHDGLPRCTRRNTTVREASICQWPAYENATIDSVRLRTAAHEETNRFVNELRRKLEAENAQRHTDSERLLAQVAHLDTRRAEPEPEPARIVTPPPTEVDGMVLASAPELLHSERAGARLRAEYERRLRWWADDLVRLDGRSQQH